jgi:hypothetical protein
MTATANVLVVELAQPETGAPNYNGDDRRELEGRLLSHGLISASLRRGELIAMVAAPKGTNPDQVAELIAGAPSRPPGTVRLAQPPR